MFHISAWLHDQSRGQSCSFWLIEKSGIYDAIAMRSNRFPVLDPFSNICPPLKEVVLTKETFSFSFSFPQKLDFFSNVTYVSEAEESKPDVEGDWERKLESDLEKNSDNGGSNDDNDFDYDTRNAFDAFEDM